MISSGVEKRCYKRCFWAQAHLSEARDRICWPLYLRHGDELWLVDVIGEPIRCWVVAVERDLVRVRLMYDAGLVPEIRAFVAHSACLDDMSDNGTRPINDFLNEALKSGG